MNAAARPDASGAPSPLLTSDRRNVRNAGLLGEVLLFNGFPGATEVTERRTKEVPSHIYVAFWLGMSYGLSGAIYLHNLHIYNMQAWSYAHRVTHFRHYSYITLGDICLYPSLEATIITRAQLLLSFLCFHFISVYVD